jgi:hypothetical protein
MKPEDFEQKLRGQSLRQIPTEWRGEIIAGAMSRVSKVEGRGQKDFRLSILVSRLSTVFWPHPKAWAGLAAIWIFIFVVNFSTRDKTPFAAEKISPPSPEMFAELKQQRLMFAQLIGANDLQPGDRQKFLPLPRSEKRFEIMAA